MIIEQEPRVLAIGAHPDDIELGAGGFIHRLSHEKCAKIEFLVLTKGVQHARPDQRYGEESREMEAREAARDLGVRSENVSILSFEDCRLNLYEHQIIRAIEERIYGHDGKPTIDMILVHSPNDTHLDHRIASEATIAAARDFHGSLLLYSSPSTKPNAFAPTFFVSLREEEIQRKVTALQRHESQRDKAFMHQSRTRGIATSWAQFLRLPDGLLEAFEVYKSFWTAS